MFKVCTNGSMAITRIYSVENEDGFVAGEVRQFILDEDRKMFERPASFCKVEAERFVEYLNRNIEEDADLIEVERFVLGWG